MSMEKRKENFLRKAKIVHNNKYDYSKADYVSAKTPITIICPKHGEFVQKQYHHLEGYGCHECTREKQLNVNFIEQARAIHGDKYDYSKFVYTNRKVKSTIICPIHGEFEMSMGAHLSKQGCPKCGHDRMKKKLSMTSDEFIAKSKSVFGDDVFDYSKVVHVNNKTPLTLICKKCGCEFNTRGDNHLNGHGCPNCPKPISQWEREVNEFIQSLGVETITSDRKVLEGKEIDIFIPSLNIGIECDGLRWHNELFRSKTYHLEKTMEALRHHIHLLHIFEDEWIYKQNIIKSIIKRKLNMVDNVIYARKCEIREVSSKDTRTFLNDNHIQGYVRSKFNYGLFHNDELVALMTFGSLRKNLGSVSKDGCYELLRYANKMNCTVIGGASRLFKHFLKSHDVVSIKSYCDIRLFSGEMYEKLGFKLTHTSQPNYFYVINRTRENRFKYRKDVLVSQGFDKNKSDKVLLNFITFFVIISNVNN